ncbi:Crp/Fnr family transcriptional regulator [Saccharopolyspora taberi]|uniref:Crp/Fnr family transcriptional regulator n=1 Tax=Saccharopolyspora taberi TaxID=60895 RepID=A0ABN3VGU7_9PSEU
MSVQFRPEEKALNPRHWPDGSLLGLLKERSREALLGLGVPIMYRPREFVIKQGDPGRHVLVLLSGSVKVVSNPGNGHDVLLAVRVGGDVLGETALFEQQRRNEDAIACTPVQARLVRGRQLADFLSRHPDVMLTFTRVLSEHLRWANHRRVDLVACPAPIRLARILVSLAARYGAATSCGLDLGIPLSQAELASLAGIALTSAEKALHWLQEEGVVQRRYRRIVVTNMARLRRFSGWNDEIPY